MESLSTLQAQLVEVQTAISACLKGRSVTAGTETLTIESLPNLERREERLLRKIAALQGSGGGPAINRGRIRRA